MKLLLHMCCGPCSCYPVKKLREEGIEPTGYFFNPNIHPYKEWEMRLKTAKEFAEKVGMAIHTDENYRIRDFLKRALPAEDIPNGRCTMCYTWRLEQTAKYAAENGFDAFTSTLFYSIYQQHDLMKRTAEHFAEKYGVKFYYEDFRPGWQEGIDISHELELYRQPYCGCIFSEEERYSKAIRKQRKKENKAKKRARLAREAAAAALSLACIFLPVQTEAAWQPSLRIGLLSGQSSVILTGVNVSGDFLVSGQAKPVKNIASGHSMTVAAEGSSFVLDGRHIPGPTLTLQAAHPKQADMFRVQVNGKTYRGAVELRLAGGKMTVVNVVRTEDYVRGVTPLEMPPSWPQEALKSQAVAARTFALKNRGRHKAQGYDLCTTTHCQTYEGTESEQAGGDTAVQATYGQVLEYQGRLIDALYHTDSGGMTENSEDVWGSRIPYLRAATEQSQRTQPWTKDIPASTLAAHFTHKGKLGTLKKVQLSPLSFGKRTADRTVSGRVRSMKLIGKDGSITVTGEEMRNAFSLRSTLFDAKLDDGVLHLTGYGWGHGLGLSQYGAKAWAAKMPYDDILRHYYTDTQIKQLYKP